MKRKKFVKILQIELDDLGDHIDGLARVYECRAASREVSERVCRENVAVLQNERRAIRHFEDVLRKVDPEACETVEALAADLKFRFQEVLRCAGLARAAYLFAARKIDRLLIYVNHPQAEQDTAASLLHLGKETRSASTVPGK
jgi:hypothetical protein